MFPVIVGTFRALTAAMYNNNSNPQFNSAMDMVDSSDSTASLDESPPGSPPMPLTSHVKNSMPIAEGRPGVSTTNGPVVSATNEKQMESLLFPNVPGHKIATSIKSQWVIDNWSQLPQKLHGPTFQAEGFDFKLLLFPQGNKTKSVSLYLEAGPTEKISTNENEKTTDSFTDLKESASGDTNRADDLTTKTTTTTTEEDPSASQWHICAQFGLVMWNPDDPTAHWTNYSHHRFTSEEKDWGFTGFCEQRMLFGGTGMGRPPIVSNDRVNIDVYVRIIDDPTGVLWHNFVNYDSKKQTGYVGLNNQGATCYLNSLLQSLYFTKVFRNLVYSIPTDSEKSDSVSVPLGLQKLFYQLSTSDDPVSTLPLTRAFGWDSADAFTQHDVQELNRVLMDKLEGKMKGTKVEGALNNIFVGQMRSFVRCVNVDFESARVEDFWDIQLNVKGMKGVAESFRDYVSVETLSGENQYMATGYGLQDANKGVIFESFPPVLHLQLKRYEYDFERDMMVKINDRYEFPEEIDLAQYMESPGNESWSYELHGVLVHSGDLNAGHYYALLKPERDGDWFRFDDDRVTRATLQEALDDNFGGEAESLLPPGVAANAMQTGRPVSQYKRHSSAYMLVYIRKSKLQEVLPKSDSGVPSQIAERIEADEQEVLAQRRKLEEQHMYMPVHVCTPKQFQAYHGVDMADWRRLNYPALSKAGSLFTEIANGEDQQGQNEMESVPQTLKLPKNMKLGELKRMLLEEYKTGADPSQAEMWVFNDRQNMTSRPSQLVRSERALQQTLEDLGSRGELRIFFDPEPRVMTLAHDSTVVRSAALFVKVFDRETQTYHGVECIVVDKDAVMSDVAKFVGASELYEEVSWGQMEVLPRDRTLTECQLDDGDILAYEIGAGVEDTTMPSKMSLRQYFIALSNRVLLRLTEVSSASPRLSIDSNNQKSNSPSPEAPKEVLLWVSLKNSYEHLVNQLAKQINRPASHIRIYGRRPLPRTGTLDMLLGRPLFFQGQNFHFDYDLSYEVLPISVDELESSRSLVVTYISEGHGEKQIELSVPKTGILSTVYEKLEAELGSNGVIENLKMWEVVGHRIHRTLNPSLPVDSVLDHGAVYAQQYSPEELECLRNPSADSKLVQVVHYQKEPHHLHGVPFTFACLPSEPFSETRVRLQRASGMTDKAFERVRVTVGNNAGAEGIHELVDDDVLYDLVVGGSAIGMDHIDKGRRFSGYNRAIVIK